MKPIDELINKFLKKGPKLSRNNEDFKQIGFFQEFMLKYLPLKAETMFSAIKKEPTTGRFIDANLEVARTATLIHPSLIVSELPSSLQDLEGMNHEEISEYIEDIFYFEYISNTGAISIGDAKEIYCIGSDLALIELYEEVMDASSVELMDIDSEETIYALEKNNELVLRLYSEEDYNISGEVRYAFVVDYDNYQIRVELEDSPEEDLDMVYTGAPLIIEGTNKVVGFYSGLRNVFVPSWIVSKNIQGIMDNL